MSARRHYQRRHSACRRRPRPDALAGADDAKVTAPEIDFEVFRVVTLSDVKVKTSVTEIQPAPARVERSEGPRIAPEGRPGRLDP